MKLIPRDATTLIGVFLALTLLLGSSAFSAVTADRTASVSVAGDDAALLAIAPHTSASEHFVDGDELHLQVTATTTKTIDPLFTITNQGSQAVGVWLEDVDNAGTSGSVDADIIGLDQDNTGNVTFFNNTFGGSTVGNCENGVPSLEGEGNAVQLEPGETLNVGLQANSSDVDPDEADLLDEMIIHADATVPGVALTDPQNHAC